MKKLWGFLFLLGGCFFGSSLNFSEADTVGKANLVFNADFENGEYAAESIPENWVTMNLPKSARIVWDNSTAYSGEKSLKIINPEENISLISEAFEVTPMRAYYSLGYVKTDAGDAPKVEMLFLTFDEQGKRIDRYQSFIKPKEEWQRLEINSGLYNRKVRYARLVFSFPKAQGQNFWLDNAGSYEILKLNK